MFDIGGTELLLIGVVALVVVGPKDLPGMFRTLGRFTAKARAMGREFSRAMEDAAKETGIDETARDLREMTSKKNLGLDALQSAASKFEKWDPMKPSTAAKGPATQALADKKAAAKVSASKPDKAAAKPAAKPRAKVVAKADAAPKPRAKATTKPTAAKSTAAKPEAAKPVDAKPALKPRKAPTRKSTT